MGVKISTCTVRIARPDDLLTTLAVYAQRDAGGTSPSVASELEQQTWARMTKTTDLSVYLAELDGLAVGTGNPADPAQSHVQLRADRVRGGGGGRVRPPPVGRRHGDDDAATGRRPDRGLQQGPAALAQAPCHRRSASSLHHARFRARGRGISYLPPRRIRKVRRSMLPKMVEYGLATEEEVLDIVDNALRDELLNVRGLTPLSSRRGAALGSARPPATSRNARRSSRERRTASSPRRDSPEPRWFPRRARP